MWPDLQIADQLPLHYGYWTDRAQVIGEGQKRAQNLAGKRKQLPQQICLYFSGQALFDLSEETHAMWMFILSIRSNRHTGTDTKQTYRLVCKLYSLQTLKRY